MAVSIWELLPAAQFHGSSRLLERKYGYCWSVILALCFCAAGSIVWATWTRFLDNPAYLTIDESKSVQLAFPSIAICPEVRFPDHRVEEFLSNICYPPGMNSSDVRPVIQQLQSFYSPDVAYTTRALVMLQDLLDYNNMAVAEASRRLTTSCEEMLLRCRLLGTVTNCSDLFVMELTSYGYGCVFNGRSLQREMKTYGIHKASPPQHIYTSMTSPFASLSVVVNNSQKLNDVDLDYKWVYIERAHQFAETGANGTPIAPGTEMWAWYHISPFYIAEDARSLSPELRGCRLSTTKLKFFPYYSKRYCILECEMLRMLQRCNCLKITHPNPFELPVCRARNLLCAKNSEAEQERCNCLAACDTTMQLVIEENYPLMSGDYITDTFYDGFNLSKVSVIRTFMYHHATKLRSRRAYFTAENLFSQIGGIFNVFFGCSVLTLLEVLQLAWCGYREYKAANILNHKSELILPPNSSTKHKKTKKKSKLNSKTK